MDSAAAAAAAVSGAASTAPSTDGSAGGSAAPVAASVPQTPHEIAWASAQSSPYVFSTWEALLGTLEGESAAVVRKSFDAFLEKFPLCYGYWNQYANYELQRAAESTYDEAYCRAVAVFERAVAAAPQVLDTWMNYITMAKNKEGGADAEEVRQLHERGVTSCPYDFKTAELWESYITFEESQPDHDQRVSALYARLLVVPMPYISQYWPKFLEFAGDKEFDAIATPEEVEAIPETVEDDAATASASATPAADGDGEAAAASETAAGDEAAAGEGAGEAADAADQAGEGGDDSATAAAAAAPAAAAPKSRKERLVEHRQKAHQAALAEGKKRERFERGITRTFYSAKPLLTDQIANWRAFLDFEESEGDSNKARAEALYLRCLIPCANYPEFWLRFASWKAGNDGAAAAASALAPAASVFLPNRPDIALMLARFQEAADDVDGARSTYESVTTGCGKGLVEAIVKRANFERRAGDAAAGGAVLKAAVDEAADSATKVILVLQHATFLETAAGDIEAARAVFSQAQSDEVSGSVDSIWLASADFERRCSPADSRVEAVSAVFEAGISSDVLKVSSKDSLWLRYQDFLDDAAADTAKLFDVETRYRKWASRNASVLGASTSEPSRKRTLGNSNIGAQAKMPRTAPTGGATGMGMGGMNGGGYDYGNYYQQQPQQQMYGAAGAGGYQQYQQGGYGGYGY